MKLTLTALAIFTSISFSFGQAFSETLKSEIGFDGYFSIGNQGGNFTLGLKYGLLQKEEESKLVVGPSVRWMRVWSNNLAIGGTPVNFNVVGGGAFLHYRVVDGLYIGSEFEALRSPVLNGPIVTVGGNKWLPHLFLGGGYSKSFEGRFRVNIGIFYDVINNLNSPYRRSYLTKKTGPNGEPGALIPILYRLELVIPFY